MFKKLLFVIGITSALWAQTPDYGRTMLGPSDMQKGTTLPATCTVGRSFFKTDATAGANIYGCTSTNTWTVEGGSGGASFSSLIPTSPNSSVTIGNTGTATPTLDVSTSYLNGLHPQLDTSGGSNTYVAGTKNIFTPSSTRAGENCVGAADPSSPVAGDRWCTTNSIWSVYDGSIVRRMVSNTSGQDLRALSTGFAKITTTTGAFTTQTSVSLSVDVTGTLPNASVAATPLPTPGTTCTFVAPRTYCVATGTMTVTVPVPAAGYEFCAINGDNVSTAITLSAIGSSAMYENSTRTGYGTAGTGTLVVAAALKNKVCILGLDSTHYLLLASDGGAITVN